ncbi:MAG: 6-carboxytetrahydropterin synthase [Halobacteriovoraceae bacterium]|nr:6-carboxytetrahydropterin synthase [Halobacteriovoraceae bacterium]MCB9095554.1 6-carboxytetrahydropterin synthase [Halobacteriovoraceae bacterium]
MKFSIAHFTIFSEKERENIHGHNYNLKFSLELRNIKNGMAFNYRDIKKKLREICQFLDEKFILQLNSPFLELKEKDNCIYVSFDNDEMKFLKRDIVLLPIVNTTLECFGEYILERIYRETAQTILLNVAKMSLKISSGPGQSFIKEVELPDLV